MAILEGVQSCRILLTSDFPFFKLLLDMAIVEGVQDIRKTLFLQRIQKQGSDVSNKTGQLFSFLQNFFTRLLLSTHNNHNGKDNEHNSKISSQQLLFSVLNSAQLSSL